VKGFLKVADKIFSSVKNKDDISFLMNSQLIKNQRDFSPTICPALNVALSGKLDGGLALGTTVFAGESRTAKSLLGLVVCKAYLDRFKDSVLVYLDSEGGTNLNYFSMLGIDTNRVIHMPLTDIEQLKFETVNIVEKLEPEDHAVFFLDSLGNIPSVKELEDAIDNKSVADMSRAKAIKSLFRILTPQLLKKNIPLVAVNHTYSSQGMFATDIMSGGQGVLLSANTVFFMSKSKEKSGTDLTGFNFRLKTYKSRCIREGSVFSINIDFERGIDKCSDLFEAALDGGFITQKSKQFYSKNEKYGDPASYRKKDFQFKETSDKIWKDILDDQEFRDFYEARYSFNGGEAKPETPKKAPAKAKEVSGEEGKAAAKEK
jgi:RecA/RadA recombinase